MLYTNIYAESGTKLNLFETIEEAITVFEDGTRKAKGTTTEKRLVEYCFVNPNFPIF